LPRARCGLVEVRCVLGEVRFVLEVGLVEMEDRFLRHSVVLREVVGVHDVVV
jgi:hypothetical protein